MKLSKIRQYLPFALAVFVVLFLSACSNNADISKCVSQEPYGFWNGLWHGIIAPIDMIAMLFRDDVIVYAPNNNGAWYAFGFLIGSGGWGFFGGHGAKEARKSKRRCD